MFEEIMTGCLVTNGFNGCLRIITFKELDQNLYEEIYTLSPVGHNAYLINQKYKKIVTDMFQHKVTGFNLQANIVKVVKHANFSVFFDNLTQELRLSDKNDELKLKLLL